jgi:hypothetical protein
MKNYRTRNGQKVFFLSLKGRAPYPMVGYVEDSSTIQQWGENGYHRDYTDLDLIEIDIYEDFKIDDPVVGWDVKGHFQQRGHFAGVGKDGRPMTWKEGRTSWTALNREDLKVSWLNCEKA